MQQQNYYYQQQTSSLTESSFQTKYYGQIALRDQIYQGDTCEIYTTTNPQIIVKMYKIQNPKSKIAFSIEQTFYNYNIKSPHILKYLEIITIILYKQEFGCILLEYCQRGNLLNYQSSNNSTLSEKQILSIARDILKALLTLHTNDPPIIHRDISPENILIGNDGKFKLCDFSQFTTKTTNIITENNRQQISQDILIYTNQLYRAPELCDLYSMYPINQSIDIWSLGILLYQLTFNKLPFNNITQIINQQYDIPVQQQQQYFNIIQFIRCILDSRPDQRPNVFQLIKKIDQIHKDNTLLTSEQILQNNSAEYTTTNINTNNNKQIIISTNNKSTGLLTQCVNKIKRMNGSTEGWLISLLEDSTSPPKYKYMKYLIIKAWNKPNKISKLYFQLLKQLQKNQQISTITIKALLVLHNYLQQGPIDVYTIAHSCDESPSLLLNNLCEFWEVAQKHQLQNPKDTQRTPELTNIILNYTKILKEKIDFGFKYQYIFEGNYCIMPLLTQQYQQQQQQIKLSSQVIEDLLDNIDMWLKFIKLIFNNNNTKQNLFKILYNISICCLNEIYHGISILTFFIEAWKQASNYQVNIDYILFSKIVKDVQLKYGIIVKDYQTIYNQILIIRQQTSKDQDNNNNEDPIIPQVPQQIIQYIKNIQITRGYVQNGNFDIFQYLNFRRNIHGLKLLQSYSSIYKEININTTDHHPHNITLVEYDFPQQKQYQQEQQQNIIKNQEVSDDDSNFDEVEQSLNKQPSFKKSISEQTYNNNKQPESIYYTADNLLSSKKHTDIIVQPEQQEFNSRFISIEKPAQESTLMNLPKITNQKKQQINFDYEEFHIIQPSPKDTRIYQYVDPESQQDIDSWIINNKYIKLGKVIGSGGSGDVFKGVFNNNKEVAVKKIKFENALDNHLKEFKREIATLTKLNPHPNLVQFVGISIHLNELWVITEFCQGGTLFNLLHKQRHITLDWKQRIQFALDIAEGVNYLHTLDKPIIHRDLKSLNLLLDKPVIGPMTQATIKIVDFGLSRTQSLNSKDKMTGQMGTFHWMAPEIFESKPYSTKADVYSFGIILWEMICRETPYRDLLSPYAIMKKVTVDQERPTTKNIPQSCPSSLIKIMKKCWHQDPNERPSFNEVIKYLKKMEIDYQTNFSCKNVFMEMYHKYF